MQTINTSSHTKSFHLERRVALIVIVLPFVGFLATMYYYWGNGLSTIDLGIFFVMTLMHELGVTAGFHRYFTYKSFRASKGLELFLGIASSIAFLWVAAHRKHHRYSDHHGDPHSPHLSERGVWRAVKGLWHSHTGWMLKYDLNDWIFYVPDLLRNPQMYWLHKTYFVWVFAGLAIPAALGGLLTLSWQGALSAFLWGSIFRIFIGHHITWSVNSICQYFGEQSFHTIDQNRNNLRY